jgi:chromosome segregation ATPase
MPGPPALSIVESPQSEPAGTHQDTGEQAEAEALLLTQLEEQWAKLAAAESCFAESEREIVALRHERDRRREQSARLVRRVRERERQLEQQHQAFGQAGRANDEHLKEIERLSLDVKGCDAEIERLRQENGRVRAQAGRFASRLRTGQEGSDQPEVAQEPVPSSHLVFVQLDDGYELLESDGPPPPLATVLELPQFCEDDFVVTRLGRSPLPADIRSCIFVQRA